MFTKGVLSFLAIWAISAVAGWTSEEQKLIDELSNAQFQDYDLDWEDYDDSGEDAGRALGEKLEKLKNKCSCSESKQCGCCASAKLFAGIKVKGCLNVTIIPEDKSFNIALSVGGNTVVNKTISAKKLERICDRLPGFLDKIKLCLYSTLTETEEEGITSCTSLDIIAFNTTAATLKFNCLQFKENKLSFEMNKDTERDSFMKIKIKNPIKGIMKLFKKKEKA